MDKKRLILPCLLAAFCSGMAHADDDGTVYAYVQQSDGTVQTSAGTAAFDVSSANSATLSFDDDGNAIMTIGDNTVAKLPLLDGAQLASDFTNGSTVTTTNAVSVVVPARAWSTFFSPFQLQVNTNPSNIEVYSPTYVGGKLKLNDGTKVNDKIIPAGSGLILNGVGTITFDLKNDIPTGNASALDGIAVQTATTTLNDLAPGGFIYSLGQVNNVVGFYEYIGTNLGAGKAYLKSTASESKKGIAFDLGDITAIDDVDASIDSAEAPKEGKFIINGKIFIIKGGKMYNLNGQEVK